MILSIVIIGGGSCTSTSRRRSSSRCRRVSFRNGLVVSVFEFCFFCFWFCLLFSLVTYLSPLFPFGTMSFASFNKKQTPLGSATAAPVQPSTQDSDIKIPNPPTDCISSLAFNGNINAPSTLLAATAWDGTVSYICWFYFHLESVSKCRHFHFTDWLIAWLVESLVDFDYFIFASILYGWCHLSCEILFFISSTCWYLIILVYVCMCF